MGKKRGPGEGSIYRRRDGLWTAQVRVDGRKVYKYAATQAEARDWLHEMRAQIQQGLTFAAAQMTVQQFMLEWLATHSAVIRPKTQMQYEQVVRSHILPGIGRIRLRDLRPDHIQGLYSRMLGNGKSRRSVALVHSVLHSALGQALRWGMVSRNAADAVDRPKSRKKEMQVLSASQVKALLKSMRGNRLEALYWLAVTTGLRQGELLGLMWSDLDWTTGRLGVQRQLQRTQGTSELFSEPKSAAGRRTVVVGQGVLRRLRAHRVVQSYERLFFRDRWRDHNLMFSSTIGTPLEPRNVFRDFKAILAQAGLPNIRFHDLRHTAATLMLQQNTNPKVVQERLGHSDISLTLNTYSHVLPDMQDQAAAALDELLSRT